jgi:HK97 family phage major capsid protein
MAVSTASANELTREQVQKILLQPLEDASVVLSSGVRIFDTNGSPVRIPKMGPATSPGWYDENELIGEVNPTFDEVTLLPETMQSLKTITRYSNELARQSIVALDAALKARLVKDVADALDNAFISGEGDEGDGSTPGTAPTGLLNMTGVTEVPFTDSVWLDVLHDAEGAALAADVDPARLRWMMRSETFTAIRKAKDGDGKYLLQPDATEAGKYVMLGHPVTVTNRIPIDATPTPDETTILLWDPSQVAVARDVMPSVKVLDQTFAQYDQQALRVVCRADIGALNAEAVIKITGVTNLF